MTTSNTGTGDVDPAVRAELARLRESIDNIDAAVVHMLAERFKCTQQVGHLKAAHQLPPADPEREARQIARLRALAESAHLDPAFAEKFLNFIIAEVIRHHEHIADTAANGTAPADGPAPADGSAPAGGTTPSDDRTPANG
ncbi:chorismate mutase [Streptomyces griseosporeus]|uniref:chorismate mutase n=1 Tax=Streptomyces griseosporeus TaxID=1910 RepID=UPI0036F9ECAC